MKFPLCTCTPYFAPSGFQGPGDAQRRIITKYGGPKGRGERENTLKTYFVLVVRQSAHH